MAKKEQYTYFEKKIRFFIIISIHFNSRISLMVKIGDALTNKLENILQFPHHNVFDMMNVKLSTQISSKTIIAKFTASSKTSN